MNMFASKYKHSQIKMLLVADVSITLPPPPPSPALTSRARTAIKQALEMSDGSTLKKFSAEVLISDLQHRGRTGGDSL